MAYADKCFYFDWTNREVPLSHPQWYDVSYWETATVRWRQPEIGSREKLVSIELWQNQDNPLYGEKANDDEVCLTRENALLLAQKLIRAVQQLDVEIQMDSLENDVRQLQRFADSKGFDEWEQEKWERENDYKKEAAKKEPMRLLDLLFEGEE